MWSANKHATQNHTTAHTFLKGDVSHCACSAFFTLSAFIVSVNQFILPNKEKTHKIRQQTNIKRLCSLCYLEVTVGQSWWRWLWNRFNRICMCLRALNGFRDFFFLCCHSWTAAMLLQRFCTQRLWNVTPTRCLGRRHSWHWFNCAVHQKSPVLSSCEVHRLSSLNSSHCFSGKKASQMVIKLELEIPPRMMSEGTVLKAQKWTSQSSHLFLCKTCAFHPVLHLHSFTLTYILFMDTQFDFLKQHSSCEAGDQPDWMNPTDVPASKRFFLQPLNTKQMGKTLNAGDQYETRTQIKHLPIL